MKKLLKKILCVLGFHKKIPYCGRYAPKDTMYQCDWCGMVL